MSDQRRVESGASLGVSLRDELVDALQHPLRDVRESVLLALGR